MAMITKNREMLLVWLALPLCLIVILAFNANALDTLLTWLQQAQSITSSLLVASLIYTLILAIPYMPSVTLGLLMMASFGSEGILAAWICTSIGLNFSFIVGRWLPGPCNQRQVDTLKRLTQWVSHTQKQIVERPGWMRYGAIALLLNLPGNSVLGGGGGIALFCGTLHKVTWPRFALTVTIATALIPALFYLGMVNLDILISLTTFPEEQT